MCKTKFLLFFAFSVFLGYSLFAQNKSHRDSIIDNQTINISQIYKPEIAKPEKPNLMPDLPKIDTIKPHFKYVVPQQTLSYTYHSIPIRPLALGKQAAISTFQNYIKAGLGNLSSLYLDAGVGSLKGENYETSFHLTHLSQKGIKANQHSSHSAFDAKGKYFLEDHVLGASLNILRDGYSYYGYNEQQYQYSKAATQQVYSGMRLQLNAANTKPNKWNIWYQPEIAFGIYGDQYNATEQSFEFNLPAKLSVDSVLSFSLSINGNLNNLKVNDTAQSNNLVQINPAVGLNLGKTQIHIGLSPTFGKNNKTYFLPDLNLNSRLLNNSLILSLGWKGVIVQNTFEQLSLQNPFLWNHFPEMQTKTDQVYFAFKSKVKQHFTFGTTLSWKQWKNMALFVNDYALNPDGKKFTVVYDEKVQALNLEAFARYQIGAVFSVEAHGSWYNFFQSTTFNNVWGQPMIRLGMGITANPINKLHINATADFWDGIYSRGLDGTSDKLPAFLDIGLSGEYNIISRWSVFLQLSNLLDSKYQRWNQYNHYGLNIIGGLRFKF